MVTRLGLSDITCNSPPLLEGSNLFRLYWSISSSLCKIDESSLDSLIPIIEVFDCCAIKQISLILGSRLLIFKCKICKPFFLTIFYLELLSALSQPKLLHSEGIVGSPWSWNGIVFKGILLLVMVVGPGLMFISTKSNKINLKNESYLCNQLFARKKKESWHLKKLFCVDFFFSKMFVEAKNVFLLLL